MLLGDASFAPSTSNKKMINSFQCSVTFSVLIENKMPNMYSDSETNIWVMHADVTA